jgi:flagellar M-ring protein FliF
MKQFWNDMTKAKQVSFVVLLALLAGLTVWGIVSVSKSQYQLLTDVSPAMFSDVVASQDKDLLDYQIDEQGRVLINEQDFSKVQMLLQQNTKPAFNSQGLELYDSVDYSMTEHTQKVTYQRALQGELERTLGALNFIEHARVHLSFAERKLFSAEQKKAKAAVTLFSHQLLTAQQIGGVQQLVAAAVDGLSAEDVTVLGGQGQILSRTEHHAFADAVGVSPHASVEQRLEQKAVKVLQMFFAETQFAISVSVDLDFSQRTAVSQQILPVVDGKGAIKQQRQTTNQQPAAANSAAVSNQSTEVEYLHGTLTEEVKDASGKIRRISLAAVIQGKVDEQTVQQLKTLLVAATGIYEARGDSISIKAIPALAPMPSNAALPDSSVTTLTQDATASITTETRVTQSAFHYGWWLSAGFIILVVLLGLLWRNKARYQQRQMTLLQVQQWLKDGQHAL